MSNAAINPAGVSTLEHAHAGHNHDPHLAHHFDTPEQQYISAKLGMWIFLGTEILMFGGLFCAYSVYRHNHQEVFEFAHQFLNKWLGALNTLVLITSSLTMAWAVRSSQLGDSKTLRWLLAVTILGGYIFLGIKSIEYHAKWQEVVFIGPNNQFRSGYTGPAIVKEEEAKSAKAQENLQKHGKSETSDVKPAEAPKAGEAVAAPGETAEAPATGEHLADAVSLAPIDPNKFVGKGDDAAKIAPPFVETGGLAPKQIEEHADEVKLRDLSSPEQKSIYTFFAVYFVMTGLHGLHVIIGMALITWVLLRRGPKNMAWAVPLIPASIGLFLAVIGIIIMPTGVGMTSGSSTSHHLIVGGLIVAVLSVIWALIWVPLRRNRSSECEFGPTYFTPVDLVGLYWHLVDMIWDLPFPVALFDSLRRN